MRPEVTDSATQRAQRSRAARSLAMVALLVVIGSIWFSPLRHYINPKAAAAYLKTVRDTWWAPLLFIGLYSLFNVLLLPGTILSLTAGVVWGWLAGGLWVLAASTIGSAIPYFMARAAGSGWIEGQIERRAGRIYEKLRSEGFITLLLMRLVPIVPYNVLNYAAGLAGIRPRDYLVATFVGTIPGIFIFTYLADSLAKGVVSPREAFLRVLLAGILLAALALSSRLLAGRLKKRLG
jgi:uncharacterized membrane protein YdjX (TVP38/TMEM64 family)